MIRERGEGREDDQAMTRGEYFELRGDKPLPDPVTLLVAAIRDAPDESWRKEAACHPDNRPDHWNDLDGRTLTPEQAERYQPWFDNARRLREALTELEARSLNLFLDTEG